MNTTSCGTRPRKTDNQIALLKSITSPRRKFGRAPSSSAKCEIIEGLI